MRGQLKQKGDILFFFFSKGKKSCLSSLILLVIPSLACKFSLCFSCSLFFTLDCSLNTLVLSLSIFISPSFPLRCMVPMHKKGNPNPRYRESRPPSLSVSFLSETLSLSGIKRTWLSRLLSTALALRITSLSPYLSLLSQITQQQGEDPAEKKRPSSPIVFMQNAQKEKTNLPSSQKTNLNRPPTLFFSPHIPSLSLILLKDLIPSLNNRTRTKIATMPCLLLDLITYYNLPFSTPSHRRSHLILTQRVI